MPHFARNLTVDPSAMGAMTAGEGVSRAVALSESDLRTTSFQRILLIKPSAVGDVIHTLPVLAKLRARYPGARIDWLLTPGLAELVGRHPALSNVLLFERQEWGRHPWRGVRGVARLLSDIRRARYDLAIDLHGQIRSALFTLASGAPTRIGFDRPRRSTIAASARHLPPHVYRHAWRGAREGSWVAYTHPIRLPTLDLHAVDRYLRLVPMLGLDDRPAEFHVPVPPEAEASINALLRQHGIDDADGSAGARPLAVLFPGTVWETKHWRAEGFTDVARHLLRSGRSVVLAGAGKDVTACRAVAAACPEVVNLCGKTRLTELAALIKRAAVCVTNDSGPMHLTVALNRPVVSIFGPTDPVWIGPYGRPDAVIRAGVPCSPCYLRALSRCPHEHACMTEVGAQTVIEAVERVIAPLPRSRATIPIHCRDT